MINDPRLDIVNQIDIQSSKFEVSSHSVVLLCGGAFEDYSENKSHIRSFRHALVRNAVNTKFQFFQPEEIKSWLDDALFKNLVEYEADLASICALIVIIPESEGSIAELGAFSQLKELREKIYVINSDELSEVQSFINLGIVRFIKERHPTRIKIYPWSRCIRNGVRADDETIEDVFHDIENEIRTSVKKQAFDPGNNTHMMTLIYELIRLFVALKLVEIETYLDKLDVSLERSETKRKLFLLEWFGFVRRHKYSDSEFYLIANQRYNKVILSNKDGLDQFNQLRASISCREYYEKSEKERHRFRVIKKLWSS